MKTKTVNSSLIERLFYNEGMSIAEIARHIKVSDTTVRYHLKKSRVSEYGDVYKNRVKAFYDAYHSDANFLKAYFHANTATIRDIENWCGLHSEENDIAKRIDLIDREMSLLLSAFKKIAGEVKPLCEKYVGRKAGEDRQGHEVVAW